MCVIIFTIKQDRSPAKILRMTLYGSCKMKKIVALVISLFLAVSLFAQSVPSTGLTDKDVKNFIKNYPTFEKEAEKIGISGPNRAEKLSMIGYCAAVCAIEQEMDAETLAMMKAMGLEDPAASIRVLINEKDYEVVKKNYAALAKIILN